MAIAYVNDATPGIYSLNRNYAAYTIEKVAGNVGFTLWDESTIRRLIVEEPDLMPYYPKKKAIKRGIDLKWGKKQITKSVTSATVTLTTPLAVDGDITVAVLQVTGSIPDDATFKVEVTNNANDPSPVWQDATVEVKKGVNIVFTNSEATNGAAFNFRVSVSRGASGTGGYIEAISGAFQ